MSDLSASNCGCNNGTPINERGFGNNWIWILILLFACGGCGGDDGIFGRSGFGNGNSSCNTAIWILILLSCCCGCNN